MKNEKSFIKVVNYKESLKRVLSLS